MRVVRGIIAGVLASMAGAASPDWIYIVALAAGLFFVFGMLAAIEAIVVHCRRVVPRNGTINYSTKRDWSAGADSQSKR